jgi:hypothetical protein
MTTDTTARLGADVLIPDTIEEARASPKAIHWEMAIETERKCLNYHQTAI